MKNLKKLSRQELKSLNGGAKTCYQDCSKGYQRCCTAGDPSLYQCVLAGSTCGVI
jgi:hypothetical protein